MRRHQTTTNAVHIARPLRHISSTIQKKYKLCIGRFLFFRSTCHSKRPSQALRALLVVDLFQVHPADSHYLTDKINLLFAQVLVPQVLFYENQKKETSNEC